MVKSFTIYGFESLEAPALPAHNVKPTMMLRGDDGAAKAKGAQLITVARLSGHAPRLTWAALTG